MRSSSHVRICQLLAKRWRAGRSLPSCNRASRCFAGSTRAAVSPRGVSPTAASPASSRCYGGSGEDIASIGADVSPMEHPMRKPNDLSRSLTVLNPETTLIAVIEMSQSSWYPASSGSSPA